MALIPYLFVVVTAAALMSPSSAQTIRIVNAQCCQFVDTVTLTNVTTIAAGTQVKWMRIGTINHSVTSGTGSTAPGAGSLFNAALNGVTPNFTFTFTTPGTFPYFCVPHELVGMSGTVIVLPAAQATSTGTGCVGSSGQPLTLTANGLPTLSNASFGMNLSGGPAGATAFLFGAIGLSAPAIPVTQNCFLFLDLATTLSLIQSGLSPLGPFTLSPTGTTSFPFPIGSSTALAGARIDVQYAVLDAGAPSGVVTSNALTIIIGL